jgi:hypothetical protein
MDILLNKSEGTNLDRAPHKSTKNIRISHCPKSRIRKTSPAYRRLRRMKKRMKAGQIGKNEKALPTSP